MLNATRSLLQGSFLWGLPSAVDPTAALPHVFMTILEKPMSTALDLNFDWDGMKHTATALSSPLFNLTRIFHPSLLRKPGRPMDTALDLNLNLESMDTYSHRPSSAPALSHQPSQLPRHENNEISGLKT